MVEKWTITTSVLAPRIVSVCYLLVFLSPAFRDLLPPISILSQAGGLAYSFTAVSLHVSLWISVGLFVSLPLSPHIPFLQYPVPWFLTFITSNLYLSNPDNRVFPPYTWNCTHAIIWDSCKLYFICFSFLRDHRPHTICCLVS